MWILIRSLRKKLADLDLHFFQIKRIKPGSAGKELIFIYDVCCFFCLFVFLGFFFFAVTTWTEKPGLSNFEDDHNE